MPEQLTHMASSTRRFASNKTFLGQPDHDRSLWNAQNWIPRPKPRPDNCDTTINPTQFAPNPIRYSRRKQWQFKLKHAAIDAWTRSNLTFFVQLETINFHVDFVSTSFFLSFFGCAFLSFFWFLPSRLFRYTSNPKRDMLAQLGARLNWIAFNGQQTNQFRILSFECLRLA